MEEIDSRFESVRDTKDATYLTKWRKESNFNKYSEDFPSIVYNLASQGKSIMQICRTLKCSKTTFDRWVVEIPDMQEAYELALVNEIASWEDKLENASYSEDPEKELPQSVPNLLTLKMKTFDKYNDKLKKVEDEGYSDADNILDKLMKNTDIFDKVSITSKAGDNITLEKNKEENYITINSFNDESL